MKTYNWPIRCRELKSNLQVRAFPFIGFFSEDLEKRLCKQMWKMIEPRGASKKERSEQTWASL